MTTTQDPQSHFDSVITLLARWFGASVGLRNASSAMVTPKFGTDGARGEWKAGRVWMVSDNGGEYNVLPINSEDEYRAVPYIDMNGAVDPMTVAHRISLIFRGEDIDWSFRMDDDGIDWLTEQP